ncbi:response regulator transcription factor [Anaerosporobacter faecicola]|uniref:response regulator transcription factor n=1 Tax=Anaerosporobacter faecicola TaxID=2718714 RepID=UPI001EE56181|nr:response regulator transcription factor [Anaerosporobacter faecicola]
MRILVIEDDIDLCNLLEFQINTQGWFADFCHDGLEALLYIERDVYDVVLLDRMLPHKDGLTILKEMRKEKNTTPVLLVTAMNTLTNRVEGLDAGADDYLIKPFEIEELFARIRAIARRNTEIHTDNTLIFSDLTIDRDLMKLICGKEECILSKRELDLLVFLIRNKDRILSRDTILNRVWGVDSFVSDGNLDNFIFFLRKRIKSVHSHVTIKTVRSVGYHLVE